jgi:hypothetical protein
MTFTLSLNKNIPTTGSYCIDKIARLNGYRGPTGLGSDYIFNKKSKIISQNTTRPLSCSSYRDRSFGLNQSDYIFNKKGFFRS